MESCGSENGAKANETLKQVQGDKTIQDDKTIQNDDLDLERIMEIAEEEIERTSQEAVKAALLEVGGELAYWKERSDLFEAENERLKLDLKQVQKSQKKIKTQWLWNGIAIGVGVAGIATGILVFCLR